MLKQQQGYLIKKLTQLTMRSKNESGMYKPIRRRVFALKKRHWNDPGHLGGSIFCRY